MNIFKQILKIVVILGILTSCQNKYKYVEIVDKESILNGTKEIKEEEEKEIKASNDSTAYLEAFTNFCISKKVNNDMKEAMGVGSIKPIKFKLLNGKNEDITNSIFFANKKKREDEIKKQIFSQENTFKKSKNQSTESKKTL